MQTTHQHNNSSPDIFKCMSDRSIPSYRIKFTDGKKRNMMENYFRDVVCKFREFTFLIREKSIYNYLKPEFLQEFKIRKDLKLFVSEIWSAPSSACLRGASGLLPYAIILPKLDLVSDLIGKYIEWTSLNDFVKISGQDWNIFDIFLQDKTKGLHSVFQFTCFELEEGEYVKKISDKGYTDFTFLTNFGHFFHVVEDKKNSKFNIAKSSDLFTGLAIGGSFWIGWTSKKLFQFGDNYYIHVGSGEIAIPNEIESIDDVSCGWDNIFIIANERKDLFGFGRNYGCYFRAKHAAQKEIIQIPLGKLKLPDETIRKVVAADESAVVLLDSGDLIINNYAMGKPPLAIGYLWSRIDSAKTLNKFDDSRIIDIGVGRSQIALLSLNHTLTLYSLRLELIGQSQLYISPSMDYPQFVNNENISESKRVARPCTDPSLLFEWKIIHGEESMQVWYHAINPIDLFQSDYKQTMHSNPNFSDISIK